MKSTHAQSRWAAIHADSGPGHGQSSLDTRARDTSALHTSAWTPDCHSHAALPPFDERHCRFVAAGWAARQSFDAWVAKNQPGAAEVLAALRAPRADESAQTAAGAARGPVH